MLIALGFLAACLLGLLVAPAFWSRAVRLTTRRIKDTVPLSEMEIEADRDRIRAEYAIKMHKLELLVEQVKLTGARQQIEINRRDARVNMLEADLERLQASYEEAQNARRVLEQTVTDRLPRVEGRPLEANKALSGRERRDAQITALQEKSDAQASEITRLKAANAGFERDAESGKGSVRDSETALKERLRSLETQATQQAETVQKLRDELALANEQLAQQAEPAGSDPKNAGNGKGAAGQSRRPAAIGRSTLADRVAQARAAVVDAADAESRSNALDTVNSSDKRSAEPAVVAVAGTVDRDLDAIATAGGRSSSGEVLKSSKGEPASARVDSGDSKPDQKRGAVVEPAIRARPRLLDRLAGLSRTS